MILSDFIKRPGKVMTGSFFFAAGKQDDVYYTIVINSYPKNLEGVQYCPKH
jgi:hypothetical protein